MLIGWLRQALVLGIMSAALILGYYLLAFWLWLGRLIRRMSKPAWSG